MYSQGILRYSPGCIDLSEVSEDVVRNPLINPMKSVTWGPTRVYFPVPFPESEEEGSLDLDELDDDVRLMQFMDDEGDSSMNSFDMEDIGEMRERRRQLSAFNESMDDLGLANATGDDTENTFSESESNSNTETNDPEEFDLILRKEDYRELGAFTFLDESMDDLDLANAKVDDIDNNFSESESNMQTADPEEFDLMLPKEDHRKSAANMRKLWGLVLAPTASEKYPRTSAENTDFGAQHSDELLTEAIFVRQMVPRSVSAPEIDLQRRSRQARAAKDPSNPSLPRDPPQPRKEIRRVSLNHASSCAEKSQPRKESSNAGALEETSPLGAQCDPPLSPDCHIPLSSK